jgi:hypothetical protein
MGKGRTMARLLIIVPCGERKIWDRNPDHGPSPAREAYIGPPFVINRQYAERFATRWVVLSAKYGFIAPNFIIPGPYNVTFKMKRTNPVSAVMLTEQVKREGLGEFEAIIGLGGAEYRDRVAVAFAENGVKPVFPFAGYPKIGKMMQAVKKATACGNPYGGARNESSVPQLPDERS